MAYIQARVDAALDAANDLIVWAILHDGDPGGAGTSFQLAESSAVQIEAGSGFPAASSGSSEVEVEFTITGAAGPITHVSLWTDDTGPDVFAGSGVLAPQETFSGAGTLTVTITTTAANA